MVSEELKEFTKPRGVDALEVAFGQVSETSLDKSWFCPDHFPELEAFARASSPLRLIALHAWELARRKVSTPCAVFHLAPQRQTTMMLWQRLQRHVNAPHCAVIASRHQAAQISAALEAGVHRCLVEPVYPSELFDVLTSVGGEIPRHQLSSSYFRPLGT
ncbi:MAG: hypothetical protein R3C68_13520 [Myxococcota bacterium]